MRTNHSSKVFAKEQAFATLAYNPMNWGYWNTPVPFSFSPGVSEGKLLEPRHMIDISDRWARSKTDDLQFAFFNGVGLVSWQDVWGIWNGFTPRAAESIRRVATVERAFAPFLTSQDWEPWTPTLQFGVFASRWPAGDEEAFTIVNRAAILRGGSYYQPQGSIWYFPQAYRKTEHGKYLLMAPSKDRSGTLGFRCVMDAGK